MVKNRRREMQSISMNVIHLMAFIEHEKMGNVATYALLVRQYSKYQILKSWGHCHRRLRNCVREMFHLESFSNMRRNC